MLTKNRDIQFFILNKLSDKDLASFCQTSKIAQKICNDEELWARRIRQKYGVEPPSKYLNGKHKIRDFYQSGRIKRYLACKNLEKSARSQLVIDDIYNPKNGFIGEKIIRDPEGMTYLLLKIVYSKLKKTDDEQIEQMKKLIEQARQAVPEWNRDDFSDEYILTEKDKKQLMKRLNFIYSSFQLDLQRSFFNLPENHHFIFKIHDGFRKEKIALDILWSELCVHPYIIQNI